MPAVGTALLRSVVRASPHAVLVLRESRVLLSSMRAEELAGRSPEGLTLEEAGLLPVQRVGDGVPALGHRTDVEMWHGPAGGRRLLSWTDVPLPDGCVLVTGVDMTSRHEAATSLRVEARTDALTGLVNRAGFLEELAADLDQPDPCLVVLFCDLDGFKAVNDGFGHAAGDVVLRTVAQRLRTTVRQGDVLARFGGDEFVVLARGLNSSAGAVLAQRLVRNVAQPIVAAPNLFTVGMTVGLAVATAGSTVQQVLDQADGEMYRAKAWRRPSSGRLGAA